MVTKRRRTHFVQPPTQAELRHWAAHPATRVPAGRAAALVHAALEAFTAQAVEEARRAQERAVRAAVDAVAAWVGAQPPGQDPAGLAEDIRAGAWVPEPIGDDAPAETPLTDPGIGGI